MKGKFRSEPLLGFLKEKQGRAGQGRASNLELASLNNSGGGGSFGLQGWSLAAWYLVWVWGEACLRGRSSASWDARGGRALNLFSC